MTHLSLALLGPLQITLDGRPLTKFDSDKVRALLIYLALEAERPLRRATLAEMFWPGQSERAARHSLRQALFNLRQIIGEQGSQPQFLLVAPDSVQFNRASDHTIDTCAFDALLRACAAHRHRRPQSCGACAERLEMALDLYRGDFLAQLVLPDTIAFDEWLLQNRERFRQDALQAGAALTTYYELRGDYERASVQAKRQLRIDPWSEPAYRKLMRALALDNQRGVALEVYRRCHRLLAEELGVEPEEETTLLYERIRDAAGSLLEHVQPERPAAPRHNLPASLTPFVGREQELAQIGELLGDPQCRLLTIHGHGGIGKTRLATQAALKQHELFPDGVCFVPLDHLSDPELLPTLVADALGLTLRGVEAPQPQLLQHLRDKELLLLLDNFEQLLGAASLLSELLREAPGVTLLVTSRERLDLHGEWLFTLAGLALPDLEHGEPLEHSGAGKLWVQTARRVQAGYALTDDDRFCVTRICALLEGMPLAIELAAGWTRVLTCAEIAQEIAGGLRLLAAGARDLPARHQSIRAVLDHSWRVLTYDEQGVLRRLAIFRGGFQREAAAQVTGASVEQLAALADKSLLRRADHPALTARYDLHELIRQYLLEQLEAAGELDHAHARQLQFFVELAEQAAPQLTGADEARWIRQLEADHANVRAALGWALAHGLLEDAGRLCVAVWRFWHIRGYVDEGRQWIARTLRLADAPPAAAGLTGVGAPGAGMPQGLRDITRAHVLKGAGVLAWAQSDYTHATAAFEASLALYQTCADVDGIAAVSSNLGVLAMHQGNFERAEELLEHSLTIRRARLDEWGTAVCLQNLGAVAGRRGDAARAQAYYEESLRLYQAVGNTRGVAMLLSNLADIAEAQGDTVQARARAMESLALRRQLGDQGGIVAALLRLGSAAHRSNGLSEARRCYAESLSLLQSLGDKEYIAIVLEGSAAISVAEGRWKQAARLWGAAEDLRQAIGVPLPPVQRAEYDEQRSHVQSELGEQAYAQAWQEGQEMSLEQAMAAALD